MKFRSLPGVLLLSVLILGLVAMGFTWMPATAGQVVLQNETPTVGGKPFILVDYNEPINVRSGPNSVYYDVVGSLPVGATAEAIGKSPKGEWIKITFPAATDGSGTGWVYAALVTLSPGFLPIVEPPPTAVPVGVPTLDPDFVASLRPAPTSTRPPTFTAPPPLVIPTYENSPHAGGALSAGLITVILAVLGLLGILVSSRRGK